ncbi:thiolase family protein [Zavarzinella formosa]|uniref:thiolase family protein n=1 Tax=Zavarzinella formosa TaxID=360055 RepID=UPI0002DD5C61|nr:acetyl-CoA C-acetyltransferase [Zavarzinella formosa]
MDAYIISAVRTPVGKFLGGLAEVQAVRLAAGLVPETLRRAGVTPPQVDEAIFGHVVQAGCGQNPARQAALFGGLPDTIPALTVNKVCGSGLKAVMLGAQAIRAGDANIVLAGGMESMSRTPHLVEGTRAGLKYGDVPFVDSLIRDGLWCPFENWPMGKAAEHTAKSSGVNREDQDRFSVESHRRAAAAWENGAFTAEVFPVTVGTGAKAKTVSRDEGIRADSNMESLGKLRPAFDPAGTVTAGNASQLSDGAAALMLASSGSANTLPTKPLARIVAYTTSGVAPKDIFIAPVPAVRQVLGKARLKLSDIDLFEINEAFAAQMLACCRELTLDATRVNVNGGAIAIGHPIGASGARVLVTLIHALHARQLRYGLAALCLGGGNAVAMIVERI